ncbi:MAG: hypothetical protein K6B41_09080 [Butyrivibrio sp.]|nr:hypothetical protein [Butyrivibrio sp.]
MCEVVAFDSTRKKLKSNSNSKYNYYNKKNDYDDDKPISAWDVNDFQDMYEMTEKQMGKNNAWKLIYELIRLRAGEARTIDTDAINWNEL